jgi:methylated-DNA-[protein]-cysteine S-methyltransferase
LSERESLLVGRLGSPLGGLLVVCNAAGRVCALDFEECEPRLVRLCRAQRGLTRDALVPAAPPRRIAESLAAFFAGDLAALDAIETQPGGTPFQRSMWAALRAIPYGRTTTYSALARALGRPNAARAVGHANAENPIAIAVPCHRVIGADGSLTGYAGGLERKRWLLEHERRWRAAA